MKYYGFAGNILNINLSEGEFRKEPISEELIRNFVGGIGILTKLAYDHIKPGVDALSPDNPVIIGIGPLGGTLAPGSSKTLLTTKFYQTGNIGTASAGCALGPKLRYAGYDAVIIKGKAKKRSYITIFDDKVELHDAEDLLGVDLYDTTEKLWARHGADCAVLAVGPAGENMLKDSLCFVDKTHSIGKGGLGAILTAKNIKAIVVRGTRDIVLANPESFAKVAGEVIHNIKNDPDHDIDVALGRMSRFDNFAYGFGWPYHNYTMTCPPEEARKYDADHYVPILVHRVACPTCVCGCKDHVEIKEGPYKGTSAYVSSLYGRVMNWGSRCVVGGMPEAIVCQDFCDRMGLCVHTISSMIDWVVDLYEKGVITKEDTDGMELRRDFETTFRLLEKTVKREGFGDILAEGWDGAIERIGRGCEKYAINVKGIEFMLDPRIHKLGTVEFFQVTNPRGGWGSRGRSAGYMKKDRPLEEFKEWCLSRGVPEYAQERIFAGGKFNVGRMTKYAEEWCYLNDVLGASCLENRVNKYYHLQTMVDLYRAATGINLSGEDLRKASDRAFVMEKILNMREGRTYRDYFPHRWFEPIMVKGEKTYLESYYHEPLAREDCEKLLSDYYEERGWDRETGLPTRKSLVDLGLGYIVENHPEFVVDK